MNTRLKKTYRQRLIDFFSKVRAHFWYQKILNLPYWIRVIIAIILFIAGLIALVTPIPLGWAMITFAAVLIFGLHIVQRQSIKLFFMLRLHRLIEYIRYKWKR